MNLLRCLLIVWFALGAPLTAAAGHRCAPTDSAASAHARHLPSLDDATHGHGSGGASHAHHDAGHTAAPTHHQTPDNPAHQMHGHPPSASGTTAMDCCDDAGACLGHACATVPGSLILGAAPFPLPAASAGERFVAPRAEDPAPGHPPTLLRPPA